jgi:hypothetical protein
MVLLTVGAYRCMISVQHAGALCAVCTSHVSGIVVCHLAKSAATVIAVWLVHSAASVYKLHKPCQTSYSADCCCMPLVQLVGNFLAPGPGAGTLWAVIHSQSVPHSKWDMLTVMLQDLTTYDRLGLSGLHFPACLLVCTNMQLWQHGYCLCLSAAFHGSQHDTMLTVVLKRPDPPNYCRDDTV